MKLAVITPDAVAQCMVCRWQWKAPKKRRKHGVVEDLLVEERFQVLEHNLLAHLRYAHDKLLLTKEESGSKEEGLRTYYHGQRPVRVR